MEYLHWVREVSMTDIAELIGSKTSGYVSWLFKKIEVKARDFEEGRLKGIADARKHKRNPFDGTDEDKAYLLGISHGDFHVSRPFGDAVRVSTSSTHPAMVELFRNLFEKYGHVYQHSRFKKDTHTYEWNLSTILDVSFSFLLEPRTECRVPRLDISQTFHCIGVSGRAIRRRRHDRRLSKCEDHFGASSLLQH